MSIKLYKPTTPGRRKTSVIDYAKFLSKSVDAPRSLFLAKSKSGGRNNAGKITVRHRGGGFKKIIRVVDFKRSGKINVPAAVQTIEYDPNRSAFICLVAYSDGEKRYIIAPDGLKIGEKVLSSEIAPIKPGNRLPLTKIPISTFVHDIELQPGQGGKLAHGAGTYAIVQAVEGGYANLKMPSGEIRKILSNCWATVGQVSNAAWMNVRVGKAGRKRLMGWRPEVRGKAMNPIDHPHGGGEGHNPIGLKYPKTPWGKHALGVKTRKPKKYSDNMILKRRK